MIEPVRIVERYALYAEIAAGGMATVHFGRLLGPVGFSRTVAIKRLHPQFAKDPDFVSMFLDEARIAARIRHPNVVGTLDVVVTEGELFLVMDYVQGESLSRLSRRGRVPTRIAISILCGALHGLHAAHEAKNEQGEPLNIVHRDISPQNILVGVDGVARLLDFGIAKARGRAQTTGEGNIRGKLAYMAPEQLLGVADQRTDIYAAAIVAWEALTGQHLFLGRNEAETMSKVMSCQIVPPSQIAPDLSHALDAIVLRGLAEDPADRYATAREMALALEACGHFASPTEVGEWVAATATAALSKRMEKISEIESSSSILRPAAKNLVEHLLSTAELPATDASATLSGRTPAPLSGRTPAPLSGRTPAPLLALTPAPPGFVAESAAIATEPAMAATEPAIAITGRPSPLSGLVPSSVSLADPSSALAKPRPASRARWLLGLAALPLLAALLFALGPLWRPAPVAPARGEPEEGAPPAASTAGSPAPPVVEPLVSPSAVAPTSASSAASAPLPGAARKAHPAPAPAKPAKPAKPGCDPPYTLDSMGRRHYRVECL